MNENSLANCILGTSVLFLFFQKKEGKGGEGWGNGLSTSIHIHVLRPGQSFVGRVGCGRKEKWGGGGCYIARPPLGVLSSGSPSTFDDATTTPHCPPSVWCFSLLFFCIIYRIDGYISAIYQKEKEKKK